MLTTPPARPADCRRQSAASSPQLAGFMGSLLAPMRGVADYGRACGRVVSDLVQDGQRSRQRICCLVGPSDQDDAGRKHASAGEEFPEVGVGYRSPCRVRAKISESLITHRVSADSASCLQTAALWLPGLWR